MKFFTNLQFPTIIIPFPLFYLKKKKIEKKGFLSTPCDRCLSQEPKAPPNRKSFAWCLFSVFSSSPSHFLFHQFNVKTVTKMLFSRYVYVNAKSLSEQQPVTLSSSVQWLLRTTTSTFLIETKNFFYNFFMMTNISNVSHLQL